MKQIFPLLLLLLLTACNSNRKATNDGGADIVMQPVGPAFDADSAFAFCQKQCDFGPRTMNSEAHEKCGEWLIDKFKEYGCEVTPQRATLTGYDGTQLKATNIIAAYRPEMTERVLLCAHWDSRPWADNDPDSANWRKPVMAANDGASGVGVLLEIARLLKNDTTKLNVGVDFICFDAEDWGTPQWSDAPDNGNTWVLGSEHWSRNPHKEGYTARFGILLDMVGAQGAQFYREYFSDLYAKSVGDKVRAAAETVGYSSYFPNSEGAAVTDDHVPVNENMKIPTVDIIPYYPDCAQSNFGPTWHTVADDMEHLDKNTLKAVGQTVVQVLYSEK